MKMTKMLSILIALTVSVISLSLPLYADSSTGNNDFTVENGVLTAYNGPGGSVTIPSAVTSIGDGAFSRCTALTDVIIPSGVTSIGNSAFADCTALMGATILNVSAKIGDNAFDGCDLLTIYGGQNSTAEQYADANSIIFSIYDVDTGGSSGGNSGDTGSSDFTIDNGVLTAYNGYGGSITIPDTVSSIGDSVFKDSDSITDVTIPQSVTSIGDSAFAGCTALTAVTISSGVQTLGDSAFADCSNLTAVSLPGSVTSIGDNAFSGCAALANATVLSAAAKIGDAAFDGCDNLTINGGKDSTAAQYASANNIAFSVCKGVFDSSGFAIDGGILTAYAGSDTSVDIPSSVTGIGDNAFAGCAKLTTVTISAGVTGIGAGAFSNCTALVTITVDSKNANYSSVDGVLFNKNRTSLIQYPAGNTSDSYVVPDSVTGISAAAFEYCTKLKAVTIESTVTNIGSHAFEGCGEALVINGFSGSCAQTFAANNKLKFNLLPPIFGTPVFSTTAPTNKNVTVTIPVTGATVKSVAHTFTANGDYTFTVKDSAGNKTSMTAKVSNIDKIKPTISINIGNGKSTSGKVIVNVTDQSLKSKTIRQNGKAIAWPKTNTFSAKGNYTVSAVDKAGNSSTAVFCIVK
jgi:hypothetical protein